MLPCPCGQAPANAITIDNLVIADCAAGHRYFLEAITTQDTPVPILDNLSSVERRLKWAEKLKMPNRNLAKQRRRKRDEESG